MTPSSGFHPHPHPGRRQGVGGAARGQVHGRHGRPAEARVEEQVLVFGGDELEVGALLADLDVERAVEECLLIPELVQPRRRVGLDAARDVEVADIPERQAPPVDLQGADRQQAALEADRFRQVRPEAHLGQALDDGAAPHAARRVAQHLVGLAQPEGDPVAVEQGPEAADVAQEVLPGRKVPGPGGLRCFARRRRRGRQGRRRLGVHGRGA